jgi:nucleoid DNA-binding protein
MSIKYTEIQTFKTLIFRAKNQLQKENPMATQHMSKTELYDAIAGQSGVDKKQVKAVLESLTDIVYKELKAQHEVLLPGLVKLSLVTKPATPEREGINPFTKEKTIFKAKPERKVIKPRPVKALKDAV